MDRKRRISRVDVQVSIVTAVLVTTALICVYFFNYFITHEDMINSLTASISMWMIMWIRPHFKIQRH